MNKPGHDFKIDITPQWKGVVPFMLEVLKNPDAPDSAKQTITQELIRLATHVDNMNAHKPDLTTYEIKTMITDWWKSDKSDAWNADFEIHIKTLLDDILKLIDPEANLPNKVHCLVCDDCFNEGSEVIKVCPSCGNENMEQTVYLTTNAN